MAKKSVIDTWGKVIKNKPDIQEYILRLHESDRSTAKPEAFMSMVKNADVPLAMDLWMSWQRGDKAFSDFAETLKLFRR